VRLSGVFKSRLESYRLANYETPSMVASPNLIDVPGAETARLTPSLRRPLNSYHSRMGCAAAFRWLGRGPKMMSCRRCDRLC
jgi:hypothetical protein